MLSGGVLTASNGYGWHLTSDAPVGGPDPAALVAGAALGVVIGVYGAVRAVVLVRAASVLSSALPDHAARRGVEVAALVASLPRSVEAARAALQAEQRRASGEPLSRLFSASQGTAQRQDADQRREVTVDG